MTCQNGKCEYNPTLNRQAQDRTLEEIKYGKLWAELKRPKLLEKRTTTSEEVIQ